MLNEMKKAFRTTESRQNGSRLEVRMVFEFSDMEAMHRADREWHEFRNELTFQERVAPWMQECFGPEISKDVTERGDRFLEEALELLQANGYDLTRVSTLVDYVASRPSGQPSQEVGGVMVTLAAYCLAKGIDMHEAGERELQRIWTKVPQIRAKQQAKRDIHGPLP